MDGCTRRTIITISSMTGLISFAGCMSIFGEEELTREQEKIVGIYEDGYQRYDQGNDVIELGRNKFDTGDYNKSLELFTLSIEEFSGSQESLSSITSERNTGWNPEARNIVNNAIETVEYGLQSAKLFVEYLRAITEDNEKDEAITRFNQAYYDYTQLDLEIPEPRKFEVAIRKH